MKMLQCPHMISFSGMTMGCMLGYPISCESCACPDKYYVEVVVTTSNSTGVEYKELSKNTKHVDSKR